MSIGFNGRDLVVKPPRYPSEEVKLELGGRWSKDDRAWLLAPTSLNVLTLCEWYGAGMLEGTPAEVRDLAELPWGFAGFSEDELTTARAHPSWSTLYDFQQEGVEYLFCNPHGAALLNLSWGMGKGAVSTVAADLLEAERVLVLAPLTLAPAWRGEWARWSTLDRDVKRAVPEDRTPGPGVTIANHEMIQEVVLLDEDGLVFSPGSPESIEAGGPHNRSPKVTKEWIKAGPTKVNEKGRTVPVRERITRVRRDYLEVDWDLIIVDESVLLKNRKATKLDVLGQLRKGRDPFMFLLSGSPITKHRDDLFPQFKMMFPRAFTSYWRFAEFFCVVDKGGWGWTIEGDRPDHDPHHYLRDLLWVKSQDEALPDLPEYIEQHMALEATPAQRKALDSMIEDWVVELEDSPADTVAADNWLARLTRLQQITSNMSSLPKPSGGFFPAASAKEDALLELIHQGDIETPLLVWSWYVETTESISRRIDAETDLRVAHVVGSMSRQAKDDTIAAYKAGELDVLVMQMSTGKFGHTFTDTKTVFYHDRAFDSDAYLQSLHRVRRIGLKHRPTLIVAKVQSSADELIDLNLEGKLGNVARLTNADLARILRSLRDES